MTKQRNLLESGLTKAGLSFVWDRTGQSVAVTGQFSKKAYHAEIQFIEKNVVLTRNGQQLHQWLDLANQKDLFPEYNIPNLTKTELATAWVLDQIEKSPISKSLEREPINYISQISLKEPLIIAGSPDKLMYIALAAVTALPQGDVDVHLVAGHRYNGEVIRGDAYFQTPTHTFIGLQDGIAAVGKYIEEEVAKSKADEQSAQELRTYLNVQGFKVELTQKADGAQNFLLIWKDSANYATATVNNSNIVFSNVDHLSRGYSDQKKQEIEEVFYGLTCKKVREFF